MKKPCAVALTLAVAALTSIAMLASPAAADDDQHSAAIAKAQAAAKSWLALADAGKTGETYDQASSLFKAHAKKADWETQLKTVRAQYGAVKGRKLKSALFATSLPGAPDGQYVVIAFETQFENKANAAETVTPMLDKDGTWRVSGYYIY